MRHKIPLSVFFTRQISLLADAIVQGAVIAARGRLFRCKPRGNALLFIMPTMSVITLDIE